MPTAARRASSTPATWRPCQSDRHRSRAPGFLQAHRPIEPSSEPRWHHQGPMSIRLNCGQPVMPLKGPLHGLHATLGLRAGGQSPTPGPPCLPAARGHSGRPPRASRGPTWPRTAPTTLASVGRTSVMVGLRPAGGDGRNWAAANRAPRGVSPITRSTIGEITA